MKEASILPKKQESVNLQQIVNSPKIQEENVEHLNEIINNSQNSNVNNTETTKPKKVLDDEDEYFDDFFE